MVLEFEPDVGQAEWFTSSSPDWARLCTLGPDGFAAYAHVALPARPEDPVADAVRPLVDVLARHTETPHNAFFGLWDGYSEIRAHTIEVLTVGKGTKSYRMPPAFSPAVLAGPRVRIHTRSYLLFRGRLGDLGRWSSTARSHGLDISLPGFSILWPADHAWFAGADTDTDYVGVGGSEALTLELEATPGLDVKRVT